MKPSKLDYVFFILLGFALLVVIVLETVNAPPYTKKIMEVCPKPGQTVIIDPVKGIELK